VNPVRPSNLPPAAAAPVQRPAEAARAAAQKAFFEAALGKASAPAPAAQAAPAAALQPVQRTPDPAAPEPQKVLRPGSLLDIRI
jgi:hypothetical protein